ncbi:hypothetical protein HNR42_003252 [Deinobacterium chartae]|uniref:Stage II sporulation protein M n=1 Tax=Deinobacterium chartae TaxID=521158 RepID=A0A841I426_9DEIO|nr:hypothetical protein [Deinobacterium chartae]MBB6099794.1 hypothetical protein [Deinobacterium chartae]
MRRAWASLLTVLVALVASLALAQTPAAEREADRAAAAWTQGEYNFQLGPAEAGDPRAARELLLRALRFTPAPADVRINTSLRRYAGTQQGGLEVYRYPVAVAGSDASIEVTVEPAGEGWRTRSVRLVANGTALPRFLFGPIPAVLFVAATLALLYGLIRPTRWREWVRRGWEAARTPLWLYITLNVLLYGAFALGMLFSYGDREIGAALREYTAGGLSSTGIGELVQGGVIPAALGISYWNFLSGAVLTTYLPGLLFGFPALLINLGRFFVLGIALSPALGSELPAAAFWLHVPTIIVELQAYIAVTCAAVAMVFKISRRGLAVFRDYVYVLPLALTILVLAAWYEAFELLVLIPLLR